MNRLQIASLALVALLACTRTRGAPVPPPDEAGAETDAGVCTDSTQGDASTSADPVAPAIAEPIDASAPSTRSTPSTPDTTDFASDDVIELQRTACYGTCPAYRVQVFGDGRVVFKGRYFVPVASAQRRIPREAAQNVFRSLAGAGFWGWNANYRIGATDLPSAIIVVKTGTRTKTVEEYPPCSGPKAAPHALCTLEEAIDSAAHTDPWTKCQDASGQPTECPRDPSDHAKGAQDAGAAQAASCSPPYTFDAAGVKHHKMQCLDR